MKQVLINFCLAVALFLFGCKTKKAESETAPTFIVTSPMQVDTSIYKDYVSQIQSVSHIELRSQERGYLQKIFVDEGQFVKKGQLMFQVMPIIYQAEMEKAKANVNYAEIEYLTTKNLSDSNIVSKSELALAKAKLDKEKAELALAKAHLAFTEIRAPFDGLMDRFQKRIGSLLEEGELLTTLSDNNKMWVYFNVPEAEYLDYSTNVKSNTPKSVKLQLANGQLFDQSGIIETIEADFNNETGNIAFRATFPNPKGILRHGQTGKILMAFLYKDAIIIPQQATFDVLDKKYVYIVDENNIVRSRQIIIAQEMPHAYIVASGLAPNEKILAEGLGKVKNDEKIKSKFEPINKILGGLNSLHAE